MEVFQKLLVWIDPVARDGPEAMSVDEWLLETAALPVLRVYRWAGDWASVGYFGKIAEARTAIADVQWVRRWTGGGMVDHRADWTYTLAVPKDEPLAQARGAESYRWIHTALAKTLAAESVVADLSGGESETGEALCFENPVSHDLIGADGRKLAGAGQRRTRRGLLHQGSVIRAGDGLASEKRAKCLAGFIAASPEIFQFQPDSDDLAARMASRYSQPRWTEKH